MFFSSYCSAANIVIANLPEMKRVLLEALDMVFVPKQIARQFVLAVALETSMVSIEVADGASFELCTLILL